MARRTQSAPKSTGIPIPADWRQTSWKIYAMLAQISPAEYETAAAAFEAQSRGRLSDDWSREWRDWCRAELVRRFEASRLPADVPNIFA